MSWLACICCREILGQSIFLSLISFAILHTETDKMLCWFLDGKFLWFCSSARSTRNIHSCLIKYLFNFCAYALAGTLHSPPLLQGICQRHSHGWGGASMCIHAVTHWEVAFRVWYLSFCLFAATEPTEVRKANSALLITLGFNIVESKARTLRLSLHLHVCSKVFSAQLCIRMYLNLIPHFILHLPLWYP